MSHESRTVSIASKDATLINVAQSHLRLFEQMRTAGYEHKDIVRLRDVYRLAMDLFSGVYRASGKPFISHLVGTASALVLMQAPADTVVAGFLHAAYEHGDFGQFRYRISTSMRDEVRKAAGNDAEALIFAYRHFVWNVETAAAFGVTAPTSEPERSVVVMRLANEIDDHLDRESLHTVTGWERRGASLDMLRHSRVCAERLGLRVFEELLLELHNDLKAADGPAMCTTDKNHAHFLPSRSSIPHPRVIVRKALDVLRR